MTTTVRPGVVEKNAQEYNDGKEKEKIFFKYLHFFTLLPSRLEFSVDLYDAVKAGERLFYCQRNPVTCSPAVVPWAPRIVLAVARLCCCAGWLRKRGRSSA